MSRKVARYGWRPDLPDHRDFLYAAPRAILAKLPRKVDLTGKCPDVYDQGQIGSCTANAIGAAVEFDQIKQKLLDVFIPSRLFIYYNERAIEHTINEDSGAMIRDGIKSVTKQGVCPERMWPYDPSPFPPNPRLTKRPYPPCYKDALKHTALEYERLPRNLSQMKGCLASDYPFVFGFTVYESFESEEVTKTGIQRARGSRLTRRIHRKRESESDVSGCRTERSQLLRLHPHTAAGPKASNRRSNRSPRYAAREGSMATVARDKIAGWDPPTCR